MLKIDLILDVWNEFICCKAEIKIMINGEKMNQDVSMILILVRIFRQVQRAVIGQLRHVLTWIPLVAKPIRDL